ncbi:metal ABC transporter substrate-binding protein [Anaeromyxobacter paludicola]|uniref:Zinc ABC transporter substrate-binding protein n=1 Tax=Anaeromyxobacter paludicola TaxID=2918171 RepID=A0ABM7X635_9BACT|nr:metal ABC transporter substrate-binding protein [Anaeromyxobacter paludicola]BDG07279.1 zinc ABC transporter substrate-binding protein [Anaeromyxobacter paludicola]
MKLRLLPLLSLLLLPLAARALDVVTTTEGLAALSREVGGDRVKVQSLSRGIQDPHFVDANPTLAVRLRQADLLVDVGLDLEIGWLPPLVNQSRNGAIQPGGARRFTAASAVNVLEVPHGPVDRSMGDLHPAGNPHFLSDPRRARKVAEGLAQKLAALDPAGAASYRQRLADFERRLDADEARWRAELAPEKGRKVIPHHNSFTYFLDWAGLQAAGYLEPKPGVAPPPSHLAELVGVAKAQGVKAILLENFYDRKSADVVARHTGAKVVPLPGDVGGTPEARSYEAYVDQLVKLVAAAVK